MIKAIAFDFGGVIEVIDQSANQKIADYLKITKDDWIRAYSSLNYLCNSGQKTYAEVFALTAEKLGANPEQVAYILEIKKENRNTRELNTELIEIIIQLKKNYKIALLSNNVVELKQDLINYNINDLFDTVVISAETGYQKPQPEIFEILFKKLDVIASEVVFIDDTAQSLSSAETVGYVPILFSDNQNLKGELKKLNIIF